VTWLLVRVVVCIIIIDRCHLRQVLEVVAGVRGVEIEALAQQVYRNTLNVFPGLDGKNGMEGEKKEGSVVVGVEGVEGVKDGVEAFTLDEEFDYDNVQLSGRKQGLEGWEEFNTGRSFNDYIETAGGEDQLVKQLSKHATTKTPVDVDKL
jgi:hypothetical protein